MKNEDISVYLSSAMDEARKQGYNQALLDCIKTCQNFRGYDESEDIIAIIYAIQNLKKEE